ncbi:MAG: hypothetical protein RIF33_00765 [Cyclobacteriaceae bacterium]
MKKFLTLIIILTTAVTASAQRPTDGEYMGMMDKAAETMYSGDHRTADSVFHVVLRNLKVLPAELAFYFGRNSFYLEKNKQAINWLNKYIELKGTKGQYFDESIQLLEVANSKFATQRNEDIAEVVAELSRDTRIDCPTGRMLCPVCNGSGVLIKEGKFDPIYQTCPFSGGDGFLTCDEYNLFLRGELAPETEIR